MSTETTPAVENFYIFNSTFYSGCEGQEEEKIVFYYPNKSTLIATQIRNVGLSEAIIKFTKNFNEKDDCQSLCTDKNAQFFLQAEPNYWMIMTIGNFKDDVNDKVWISNLKRCYRMLSLFFGSFESLLESVNGDKTSFRETVKNFLNQYIEDGIANGEFNCDVVQQIFQGIQYMPLDKTPYLHVLRFVNLFQASFEDHVRYSAFLFNHHLVWNNIDCGDEIQTIYTFLIKKVLSKSLAEKESEAEEEVFNKAAFGRFVTRPEDYYVPPEQNPKQFPFQSPPKIVVKNTYGCGNCKYNLLVYSMLSSFFCMLVEEGMPLTREFLQSVEAFLTAKMVGVASELLAYSRNKGKRAGAKLAAQKGCAAGLATPDSQQSTFLYFNWVNLARKSTLTERDKVFYPYIADAHFDKKKVQGEICETTMKTVDGEWIVAQMCNQREFFVIIPQKKAALIDVNEEVRKISEKQLKSIFFHV